MLDSAAEPRVNATCDCRDFTHRCIAVKSDRRFFDIIRCITRMFVFLARVVEAYKNHAIFNRCFSILLSGCETGQRFRCYVVATPSAARSTSIVLYANPTMTM